MRRLPLLPSWHLTQGIIGLLCLALSGQLLLQSFSLPHETPRAAIKRLIDVDIALTACPIPADTRTPHHPHHYNGDCTLCPLLGHIFFAVSPEIIRPDILLPYYASRPAPPAQPRAPPPSYYQRPPSRAPPLFT